MSEGMRGGAKNSWEGSLLLSLLPRQLPLPPLQLPFQWLLRCLRFLLGPARGATSLARAILPLDMGWAGVRSTWTPLDSLPVLQRPLRLSEGPGGSRVLSPAPPFCHSTGRRAAPTARVPSLPRTSARTNQVMEMMEGPGMEMRLLKTYVLVTALSLSAAFASTTRNAHVTKIILKVFVFAAVKHISAKLPPQKWHLNTAPGIKFLNLFGLSWREGTSMLS